jgi:hypothetical protein
MILWLTLNKKPEYILVRKLINNFPKVIKVQIKKARQPGYLFFNENTLLMWKPK